MNAPVTAYEVVAFSDDRLGGSPTGVVLNAHTLETDHMQRIATKLGYSHTAFVYEVNPVTSEVRIRFFTPLREITNCGHATIAAHYLLASLAEDETPTQIVQKTDSSTQNVEIHDTDDGIHIYFKQNKIVFTPVSSDTGQELLEALNLKWDALDSRYPIVLASPGTNRFLVAMRSTAELNSLTPNYDALHNVCQHHNSIGCFAFVLRSTESPIEAIARMFAPVIGVNEDIINGNSSGCLGAYLMIFAERDGFGDALDVHVRQGQMFGRDGLVKVKVRTSNNDIETVVGGKAVTVSKLELDLP